MDVVRARSAPRLPLRVRTALLVVAGIVALAALTTWLRRTASADEGVLVERTAVLTGKVRRGDLVRQAPVQGALVPEHIEWLPATSAGQVSRIEVRAGAEVEAGDVVLVLTNADLELAALDAERAAATAESALVQLDVRTASDSKLAASSLVGLRADAVDAQRHADAADRLRPEGLMSSLDFDDAKNRARGLSDRVDSEAARLSLLEGGRPRQLVAQRAELARLKEIATFARKRLDGLVIKAPIKGVVQDVPLELGQWMQVGSVPREERGRRIRRAREGVVERRQSLRRDRGGRRGPAWATRRICSCRSSRRSRTGRASGSCSAVRSSRRTAGD